MTTCNHAFCRVCLFECFKRLSLMRCPICNSTLNKRSCASCPLLQSAVQRYLLLAKAFKKDLLSTEFAKENDFIESQIPVTQAFSASGPLLLQRNQYESDSVANPKRSVSKGAKRRCSDHRHRGGKLRRVDQKSRLDVTVVSPAKPETADSNSREEHYSDMYDIGVDCSTEPKNSSFKEVQTDFEEFCNVKEVSDVIIQTETEIKQGKNHCDGTMITVGALARVEMVDCSVQVESEMMDGRNRQSDATIRADPSVAVEMAVNSLHEQAEEQSRIEVLLMCMPWIPDFLCLSREELISVINGAKAEDGISKDESKNDIELVLESDEETEMINSADVSYAVVPHTHNSNLQQNHDASQIQNNRTVLPVEDEQRKEENAMRYFLMVSGASKLSHQALLREFLDNFSSFQLSTSINRRCTHLVIFNANGFVCEYWSLKLIYALVSHCLVVSYEWLDECLKQKSLVPTDRFEVSLKIDENLINITAQRAIVDPSTIFNGYAFYVPQTFFRTQLVSRDIFLEIIELSGGKVVSHVWELPSERSCIIFAPDCLSQDAARRFEFDVKKQVLTADWIFASIGQHRILDTEPYRIIHLLD